MKLRGDTYFISIIHISLLQHFVWSLLITNLARSWANPIQFKTWVSSSYLPPWVKHFLSHVTYSSCTIKTIRTLNFRFCRIIEQKRKLWYSLFLLKNFTFTITKENFPCKYTSESWNVHVSRYSCRYLVWSLLTDARSSLILTQYRRKWGRWDMSRQGGEKKYIKVFIKLHQNSSRGRHKRAGIMHLII